MQDNKVIYAKIEHVVDNYSEVLEIQDIASSVYNSIKQKYDLHVVLNIEGDYRVTIIVYEDRLQEDKSK